MLNLNRIEGTPFNVRKDRVGGLVIGFLGFRILLSDEGQITGEGRKEARQKSDISFSPLGVQESVAQERRFLLGVFIGQPTGNSARLLTLPVHPFDFGLGRSIGGDRIGKYK